MLYAAPRVCRGNDPLGSTRSAGMMVYGAFHGVFDSCVVSQPPCDESLTCRSIYERYSLCLCPLFVDAYIIETGSGTKSLQYSPPTCCVCSIEVEVRGKRVSKWFKWQATHALHFVYIYDSYYKACLVFVHVCTRTHPVVLWL